MKRNRIFIVLLIIITTGIFSCGRKAVPSLVTGKPGKNFDTAAFSFYYVEAIKQKLMGNNSDALKYLEQCVKINPVSDAAYYQLAQIMISKQDIKNGKKYASMALSINNKNIWYLMMMAGMYYQEKNLDSAIIYYENAVKYFPDNENLQLTLGNLYSENRNYGKANSIFENFDKKYGINEASTLSSIKSLMAAESYDQALVKTQLLLKQYPDELLYNGLLAEIYRGMGEKEKALKVYDNLLERNPDNAQTQLSLCDFLLTEKSYDELFRILNTVILNNNIDKGDKISLFARIVEIPDIIKDYEDKLTITLLVLEANFSDDDIVVLLRPELLMGIGKLKDASARLEEIIKLKPENYYAWERLLLVYQQMGDFKKLMEKGEECSTRFNRSFLAKVLYANGAIENAKYPLALEELRKAEILAGDNKDFMIQVLTMRADVYYRMKDYAKSFEVFDEALKTNSKDLTVMNNYAYYLAEQNIRLKEAEDLARKVIDSEKGNNTFLDTYAWVLYKRGKLKEASKIMESIIESGEKPDAEWYEHFGFILKKQKKCSRAIENWNIAVRLDSTKTDLIKEIQNCGN